MAASIAAWIKDAELQLAATSDSARLDAELILGHVMQVNRAHIFAWPEQKIADNHQEDLEHYLKRRKLGEPIAYLLQQKEFYGLSFLVTKDTLIPRPDTELLVTIAKSLLSPIPAPKVADLGTGSGAIALTLAQELPDARILATDNCAKALFIAQKNCQHLALNNVSFSQGSWCNALPDELFDMIIANPPYLATEELKIAAAELQFEPKIALTSGKDGDEALEMIIRSAYSFLKPNAYVILEHGATQGAIVRTFFARYGYGFIETYQDLRNLDRVTLAKRAI